MTLTPKLKFIPLFVAVLFTLCAYIYQISPVNMKTRSTDIYYVKSIDKELLCWDKKCYQSIVQTDKPKLIQVKKTLFSFSKKLLTIEDKFHNIDLPIYNYVVKDKNIYFVVNDSFLPSSLPHPGSGTQNRALSTVYSYSPADNHLKRLYLYEDAVWIKDISPDGQYLLLSNNFMVEVTTQKSHYIGKVVNFKWTDISRYQAEYQDTCPNNQNLINNCEISEGYSKCDYPYDLTTSFYKYFKDGENIYVTATFDNPDTWSDDGLMSKISRYPDYSPGKLQISYSVECHFPRDQKSITKNISIGGREGILYVYPYQNNYDDTSEIMSKEVVRPQYIARAIVTTNNHDLVWDLSINGSQDSRVDRRDYFTALADFNKILSTVTLQFRKSL